MKDGLLCFLTLIYGQKTGENHVEHSYSMSLGRYYCLMCVGGFLFEAQQTEWSHSRHCPAGRTGELQLGNILPDGSRNPGWDPAAITVKKKAADPGFNRYVGALSRRNSGTAVSTTIHYFSGLVPAEVIHLGDVVLLSLKGSSLVWEPAYNQVPHHF